MQNRFLIEVSGIVQGVGFRPYIYRLAQRLHLHGFVNNSSDGVIIEIEGDEKNTRNFVTTLSHQPPPLAQITNISLSEISPKGETGFLIVKSETLHQRNTLISPDITICNDCKHEMMDPEDRRYLYPFINCTNCGPRYTIISDIPYDRPKTSMVDFKMCLNCQSEYDNPLDRRFHAQPNACSICGPSLEFIGIDQTENTENPVRALISHLEAGEIVAIKGVGGFHLAVNARNHTAVKSLRSRKHRFEKPLALMISDLQTISQIAYVNDAERTQLLSQHRPIVLCRKKNNDELSKAISPDNDYYGIMLPYSPLHELIFRQGNLDVLVMTSANISEEPICYKNDECFSRMESIADGYLIHDRDIYIRCDDSVLQVYDDQPFFIRRARGYAPRPVILSKKGKQILAVGGHLKNTVCLTKDNFAFVSQHIGDLENLQTLYAFEHTINNLQTLFEINPEYIIHDLHPEYLSTKWVQENADVPYKPVQHHYAHILSVMAEHGIEKDIIGFALDGTGFGEDGAIWGGEVLLCNLNTFRRMANFEYLPMPGGDKAIKEPWRMAVSYLYKYFKNGSDLAHILFGEKSSEITIVEQMIEKKINAPLTSSCGRLFDAVAAILGVRQTVAYEGQAAIILESLAEKSLSEIPKIGEFNIIQKGDHRVIDPNEIINNIVKYIQQNKSAPEISHAFHNALVDVFIRLAVIIKKETGISQIALSGGCFQNIRLLTGIHNQLRQNGFTVFTNSEVPVNDGGIALGQAYWGMHNCED